MALGIGFGAERIGLAAIRWPKLAALALLLVLAAIGLSLPKLQFDDDIHRVFLTDSAVSKAQVAYRAAQDPPQSTILAYVTSERAFGARDLARLRDLTLDLEFLEGVLGVASPFALRFPPDEGAANGRAVFGPEVTNTYVDDLERFRALDTGLPSFVNSKHTALLIAISVGIEQTNVAELASQIQDEFDVALPTGLRVQLTGEDLISHEIVTGLKDDLIALNLWGSLLVGFIALVLLRDFRMVALSVVPALCGAASVLALSVWLGTPINVLSNVIPILLLILGVADGVHLAGHLKSTGDTPAQTVTRIGPACALTAITTALAFGSIMITKNEQLFEFALLGALGTILAFVIGILTFALLAQIIAPRQGQAALFAGVAAHRLTTFGATRARAVLLVCLVLFGFCAFGFQQTKAWFPLYQNLPTGSATVQVNDAITEDFGGVFQMIIDVVGPWDELVALTDDLRVIAGPEAVLSEVAVARWLGVDGPPSSDDLSAVPSNIVQQLRPSETVRRIFVSVPEPMRNEAALAQLDQLFESAETHGAQRIFGLPTVMRQEAVVLISQLSRSLVLASIGATLIVALAFGSLRLFPLLLLPNLLPLMVTGASLHIWAAGQLSPTAVLALTIAFGIAIDDSVHFLNRFFEARKVGASKEQAVRAASGSAGHVMVLTTVLLTFGLAVTQISGFFPIRLFGGMMIITLWAALVFDLLLLPALLGGKERENA
ncbi:RND transporter [Planktotalea sp.]|uniref:efflux RND transporter permease subunit n=1 Tax=Planktotalea sp. TaxID=2029877 RepID=UPI0032973773